MWRSKPGENVASNQCSNVAGIMVGGRGKNLPAGEINGKSAMKVGFEKKIEVDRSIAEGGGEGLGVAADFLFFVGGRCRRGETVLGKNFLAYGENFLEICR